MVGKTLSLLIHKVFKGHSSALCCYSKGKPSYIDESKPFSIAQPKSGLLSGYCSPLTRGDLRKLLKSWKHSHGTKLMGQHLEDRKRA